MTIQYEWVVFRSRPSKRREEKLTESKRCSYICLASKKTPSIPTSGTDSKIKVLPEFTRDDELPAGSGDDSSLYPLTIYGDLKIVVVSDGNGSMNSHTLYQYELDLKNYSASCENNVSNRHTLPQCNESSYFTSMDGDVENCDVSVGHGSMNSHYS